MDYGNTTPFYVKDPGKMTQKSGCETRHRQ